MAGSTAVVDLVAEVTAEVSSAVADFDHLGDAVSDAAGEADKASRMFDGAAEATDNLDTKASAATGALGALSSGFDLVGLGGFSDALNNAALATDFLSGVGASATLILESEQVAMLKTTIATVKNSAATAVNTVKTAAMTAAQWALNTALEANPIGLVVVAIVALIAVFALLYAKFPPVRNAINAVWDALRAGAQAVPAIVRAAFGSIQDAAEKVVGWLRSTWSGITKLITDPVTKAVDAVQGAFEGIGGAALDALTTVANNIIDIVNDLIRAFNKLPGPNLPTISHVGGASASSAARAASAAMVPAGWVTGRSYAGATATAGTGGTTVINVYGAVDPEGTARQIRGMLEGSDIRHGAQTQARTLRTLRPGT